jgi:cyclopropane fatty-acyl-phospholipid synthase-like methyltransferase
MLTEGFKDLAGAVRKGGTVASEEGTIAPEHPIWVKFARAMTGMMALPAQLMANLVDEKAERKLRVLDIAAGHGLYGIAFATKNPKTEVVALDWPNVIEVARENAGKAGIADRYQTIPGSAFDVDCGSGYDLVLLTNFLHHFDPATCVTLLRKTHAALADGGRAVILEFVPNNDRISPPETAGFSLMMLGSTPAGDAYTFPELEQMCSAAGFARSEIHQLPPSVQQVVISHK